MQKGGKLGKNFFFILSFLITAIVGVAFSKQEP